MPWVDKDKWSIAIDAAGRRSGKTQIGYPGNRVTPNGYFGVHARFGTRTPELPNGARQPDVDAPNLLFFHYATTDVPFPKARNQAWGKLVNKVRQGPASLGVAFAEMRESLSMIANRFSQLYGGYRDLRRGKFRSFLKRFGIHAKRKHRNLVKSKVRDASNLWLEYSFGWEPLCRDIYDGLTAMGQPVPGGRFRGKGKELYERDNDHEEFSTNGRCLMGAYVSIENPNLYLAQQMGVANPLQIVWELVPFSFVADWVFDVGSCLEGLTDFFGCKIEHPYTTYSASANVTAKWKFEDEDNPGEYLFQILSGPCAIVHRKLGLDFPLPNFSISANLGKSLKRAANAASLLGQLMTK